MTRNVTPGLGDALDVWDVGSVEWKAHVRSPKPPRANVSASCSAGYGDALRAVRDLAATQLETLVRLMCGRSETPKTLSSLCHMSEVPLHHIVIEQKGRGFYVNQGGGP